jgi:hypothetical protein
LQSEEGADEVLVMDNRLSLLDVLIDSEGWEVQLGARLRQDILYEFQRLLERQAIAQSDEGQLVGKAQTSMRLPTVSYLFKVIAIELGKTDQILVREG